MREIIQVSSDKLWIPKLPYSYGCRVPANSDLIFFAGAISIDKDGTLVGRGDLKAQAKQVIENIKAALEAAEATVNDVVFARVLAIDVNDFVGISDYLREICPEIFGTEPGAQDAVPGTLHGVRQIGMEGCLTEIEVIAAVPRKT